MPACITDIRFNILCVFISIPGCLSAHGTFGDDRPDFVESIPYARASNKELRELWPFLFFGAYILVSIISVLLHSQNYRYSFFEIGLQILTIIAAMFVFLIIDNERKASVFMATILSFGLFEAALGLFGVLYSSLSMNAVMAQETPYTFMVPTGSQTRQMFSALICCLLRLSHGCFLEPPKNKETR